MIKWGLGIEHEMRVRFKKNISELPQNIIDTLFTNIKNEYMFIDSNTLLYYFKIYETVFMTDFKKFMLDKLDKNEQKYYNKILLKNELFNMAKNKIHFPLEDKKFFDLNDKDLCIELLSYYLMIYTLYHSQLLFCSYNFNNEINLSLKKLMKFDIIIKENNVIDLFKSSLDKLYNDTYAKLVFIYLKQLFIKKNVKDFDFLHNSENMNIDIYFRFDNSVNSVNSNKSSKFMLTLNKYLDETKKIFSSVSPPSPIQISYKNLYMLYSNNIPHIDKTCKTEAIEFKTIVYENLSYEHILSDLIELEKTFFNIVNNIPIIKDLTKMFGKLMYHNIGSVQNTISIFDLVNINYRHIEEDYTGSYHIWITAPYDIKMPMKKFLNIHATLANKLQLLEPILAAHYSSPSYNALKSSNESKSSLRQFLNGFSNYGTTDISLINGAKKHDVHSYYISEQNKINNKPIKIYNGNNSKINNRYIYDDNNKIIKNYGKLITRNITNNIFKLFDKGNDESNNNISVRNYFSIIFEKTKIRPKEKYLKLGADIRTRDFNNYFYPRDTYLLMKHNKLYQKSKSYKLFKPDLSNRIGIEFRIFDHFPTHYLSQILCLLAPIVLDSTENIKIIKTIKDTHISKQFWHNEMANVILKGYEYTLSDKYISSLEKEFNINININKKIPHSTENILSIMYEKLNKRYSKKSLYNKMKFTTEINFISFNKKAWHEIINSYFKENPNLLKKILLTNKLKISEILGKNFNYDLKKIMNYVKLL